MLFSDRLYKYALNDETNYQTILDIVSKLKWIKSNEVNNFIKKYINDNYSIYNLYIDFKNCASSSSTGLIYIISNEGLCNNSQILKKNEINYRKIKKYKKIFFVDDYIGSGETIIKAIDSIWSYIKDKELYIVSYACQKKGKENIIYKYPNVNLIYSILLDDYTSNYNDKEINYINLICKHCLIKEYEFGYNSVGAFVVLNNKAPNSDISMLWHPGIIYNDQPWMNLFDRELSFSLLNHKYKEVVKKNTFILKIKFKKISSIYSISFDEFMFLVYSYGCYYTKEQLINDKYFDNENELNYFIKNLIKHNYIGIKNGYFVILNKALCCDIKKIIDSIYRDKKKNRKNITCNFK